jgi:hypothetical protein
VFDHAGERRLSRRRTRGSQKWVSPVKWIICDIWRCSFKRRCQYAPEKTVSPDDVEWKQWWVRKLDADVVAGNDDSSLEQDRHNAGVSYNLAIGPLAEDGSEKSPLKGVDLRAGISNAGGPEGQRREG